MPFDFTLPTLIGLLAAATGAVLFIDRAASHRGFVVIGVFTARGIVPALSGVVGAFLVSESLAAPELWLGRLTTLILLVTVGLVLLRPHPSRSGHMLVVAGLSYYAGTLFLAILYTTTDFGYVQNSALICLALAALWAAPSIDAGLVAQAGKVAAGLVLVGTLATVALNAPSAWWPDASGSIPGVPGRLQGGAGHPNGLATIAIVYLLLERYRPSAVWLRLSMSTLAVTALVLAASKTAWLAAVVVAALVWAQDPGRSREARVVVGLGVVALLTTYTMLGDSVSQVVDPETFTRIRTLTGRTSLWQVGFDAWRESPLVGAGPRFFETYAAQSGEFWAGQAHNQFVQTLTEHGILGLIALLFYISAMVTVATRHSRRTRAVSTALVILLLIRSISETPFETLGLEHLVAYALLIALERETSARAVTRTRAGEARRSGREARVRT